MKESPSYHESYQWITLFLFSVVAGVSQMLMLAFAPLIGWLQNEYGVTEAMASLNLLLFPLLYVILSLYAGALIDKRGYKYTVRLGAIFMAIGAFLRIFVNDFSMIILGSFIIAVGHPFVVNSITKLVCDGFANEELALATGLASSGVLLGMIFGLLLTPLLVQNIGIAEYHDSFLNNNAC